MKTSIVLGLLLLATATSAAEVVGGFIPPPHPLTHLTNRCVQAASGKLLLKATSDTLPAKYDLRDVDGTTYLSPVRNQNPYGTCWAFATMAPLEYLIRRNEGIDANLSENNLANLHGFDLGFSDGGNYFISMAVLLREDAPITEALDPYASVGTSVRERGVRIPRKVVFVPARSQFVRKGRLNTSQFETDLNAIKQALMTYGPLATDYYHSDSYLNGSAYYCPYDSDSNHAVTIVGWDDDYEASNFKSTPSGNGAFIIRNSWGASWGDKGYMYISYYDRTLGFNTSIAFAKLSDGSDYGHIYQYDRFGNVSSYGYSRSSSAYGANVFTAITNETLTAFGFYALVENASYTASIIVNPTLTDTSIAGTEIQVASGTCADAGYEVIPFSTPVSVNAGDTFAIVVKVTTQNYSRPIAVSENYNEYCSGLEAVPHLSYMRSKSTSAWEDMSTEAIYFCCKVYCAPLSSTATSSTAVPIAKSWLDRYSAQAAALNCLSNQFYGAYNALAEHVGANGKAVGDAYLLGLDPDNATETNLLATLAFDAQGEPVIDVSPKNAALWSYSVLGSENLRDWHLKVDGDTFFTIVAQPR